MAQILIVDPLIAGFAIGLYEAIIIHRDINIPGQRFKHALHALGFSILFVFCTMNAPFLLNLIPAISSIPLIGTVLGFQIAIGFIAALKIHAVGKFIKVSGQNLSETWFHSILIGTLITTAPYTYPLIKPILFKWF